MARKSDLTSAAALLGRKGGTARAENLTAAERSAESRRVAKARWAHASKKDRAAIGQRLAEARAAKRRAREQQSKL